MTAELAKSTRVPDNREVTFETAGARHRQTRFQDQEVLGPTMKRPTTQFALCLDNAGNEASLIRGKAIGC